MWVEVLFGVSICLMLLGFVLFMVEYKILEMLRTAPLWAKIFLVGAILGFIAIIFAAVEMRG